MKKSSRGFTLVEIIGVITVLSVILIFSVPALTRTLKTNEQKKYDDYIDNIRIASENYMIDKLKEGKFFEDGKNYNYITLGNLIDSSYVKETIANPENDKELSRDTRIKISKEIDGTYSYDVQEYYNTTGDYNKDNLIIHYDAVEYSKDNVFKSLTNEIDYDYSTAAQWTETGILYDKTRSSAPQTLLSESYSTDKITISFNIRSLEELGVGSSDYTYPLYLRNYIDNSMKQATYTGFRRNIGLFYQNFSGGTQHNIVFSGPALTIKKDKNYTVTFVQDGLTTRSLYLNGVLMKTFTDLSLSNNIEYNRIQISPRLYNLKLNNVLVYNKAMSGEEIQDLYQLDKERFGE